MQKNGKGLLFVIPMRAPFLFLRFSFFLQIPYLIFKQGIMENS